MPSMRLVCAKEGVRGRKGSRPRTPLMLSPSGVKADAVGDKMAGNQMFRIGYFPVGNVWRGGLPPGCDGEEDVLKNADGRTLSAVFPAG